MELKLPFLGSTNPALTSQISIAVLSLAVMWWLVRALRPSPYNFKRVGKPWWLQMLPAMLSMEWRIDKYVQDGYDKVRQSAGIKAFLSNVVTNTI